MLELRTEACEAVSKSFLIDSGGGEGNSDTRQLGPKGYLRDTVKLAVEYGVLLEHKGQSGACWSYVMLSS